MPENESIENVKRRKLIAEAKIKEEQSEIERLKKEKLLASLVSIKDVEETFLEIASKTKAHLNRLVAELPPRLEGLTAAEMIEVIREAVDHVCFILYSSIKTEQDSGIIDQEEMEDLEDDQ